MTETLATQRAVHLLIDIELSDCLRLSDTDTWTGPIAISTRLELISMYHQLSTADVTLTMRNFSSQIFSRPAWR